MADLAAFTRFARTFQPGEVIFAEYEPGDSFYLIQAGRVKISKIMMARYSALARYSS